MSNVTINPQWVRHNALYNEGGEGYNPYPKWIAKAQARHNTATVAANRMLRDERGNLIPERKMAERLARDEASLQTVTDETARAILLESIAFARAALA